MAGSASYGQAAVSAHRGGGEDAPGGTHEAYLASVRTGAEYVEFDIRRTADNRLVAFHDAAVAPGQPVATISYAELCLTAGRQVPLAADIMRIIAGRAKGHLDLKERGDEELIIGQALEILGPGNFVATTTDDACAAAIRARFPDVQVGLSLGRDLAGLPATRKVRTRASELFPLARIRASGANWCAVHHRLAVAGVLRQCHRQAIKTMVWTVNDDALIGRLLADPRVDVLVTDRPRHALALRSRLR
jgi:glycerophosphoryl diester phosphodiesterase